MSNVTNLILIGGVTFGVLGGVTLLSHIYILNNIKTRMLFFRVIDHSSNFRDNSVKIIKLDKKEERRKQPIIVF